MSAWLARLLTAQTFCRSEPKAFEPNLCRACKSVLLEQTPGSTWLSGLQRVSLSQPPPRNTSSSSLAQKHQENLPGSRVSCISFTWREREKAAWRMTRAGGQGSAHYCCWHGCRPQGVWGARTTLCTRGAVQDGRVPCQDSKGWQVWLPRWISPWCT